MKPDELLANAIIPALTALNLDSPQARHQLLAIALQESGLKHRRQVTSTGKEDGPAVSFWQFEKGGGCKGVLTHIATQGRMRAACATHGVEATPAALWEAMKTNDVLGAIAARLLLYTLPQPLPMASVDGWNQYIAAWRPGKPHPGKWADNWHEAGRAVRGFV
ncbi:MAG: hypothetical protein V4641_00950 [Pseudomonadota bacterium]